MVFWILLGIAAAVLGISYICYRMAFYAPQRQETASDTVEIPEGEIYEVFREQMESWIIISHRFIPTPYILITTGMKSVM